MTEQGWLTGADPTTLLASVRSTHSERKRRLFECACCHRLWAQLDDDRSREAVKAAERYVDGLATAEELEHAANEAAGVSEAFWISNFDGPGVPLPTIADAAYNVAVPLGWWGGAPAFAPPYFIILERVKGRDAEASAQCVLVRDIFGNPFRPVTFDPNWRTTTALALAQGIYDERAFDRFPILADALQDAGCDNEDILNHLRDPSATHVRGCWALDLVLGKE
jgi:hypothetical protein